MKEEQIVYSPGNTGGVYTLYRVATYRKYKVIWA